MELLDPEDVMRIARRFAPEPIAVSLVHADRNAIFRVDGGAHSYALKVFVVDATGLARELAARSLVGNALPLCRVVASSIDDVEHPPYLAMEWSGARPLSLLMRDAAAATLEPALEDAAFAAAKLAGLPPDVVANGRRLLPDGTLFALRFGAPAFLNELARIAPVLGARTRDDVTHRIRAVLVRASVGGWCDDAVVVHGDFKPNNLLFRDDGAIEAILDWELAAIDSRWADLSQLLRHAESDEHEERLAAGYARRGKLPCDWRRWARTYDLARIAIGLSKPTLDGDDIREWFTYLEGCLVAVETGNPEAARLAARHLLRPLGRTS